MVSGSFHALVVWPLCWRYSLAGVERGIDVPLWSSVFCRGPVSVHVSDDAAGAISVERSHCPSRVTSLKRSD